MKNNSGGVQECFFCGSPFQIMTALHLALIMKKEGTTDLYVVDHFPQADKLADRIDKTGTFRNVTLVHEKIVGKYVKGISNQPKLVRWPRMAFSYLRINSIAKSILKDNYDRRYDFMYVSSRSLINRMTAMYFAKRGYGTEIVFYEDGLSSYYKKDYLEPRALDRIYRRILIGKNAATIKTKKLLLYNPDLLRIAGVINVSDVDVKAIPKWEQTREFTRVMNDVFSYSDEDAIEEPIIIFDGLYTGEKRQIMDSFYQKVVDIAGTENVIIKKHPRVKEPETQGLKYYRRTDLPFELLCLNANMEGKLLIGLFTAAIATPKLLLGKEPYVLPLNKIKRMAEGTLGVKFGDIREMYKDKKKFFVAENENDALDFVKKYCERFTRK